MADTTLTYTIPEGKAAEYVAAYTKIHRNETPEDEDPISDGQHVKQHILEYIRAQVKRGLLIIQREALAAQNADDIT